MSKKILHVKDGRVVAVSLSDEPNTRLYGEAVETELDSPFGVGDAYPPSADAPKADDVTIHGLIRGQEAKDEKTVVKKSDKKAAE